MSDVLISATGISKSYRRLNTTWSRINAVLSPDTINDDSFVALSPMDLAVRSGESLGIVGRNGSGKSTLLSIIAGVLVPSTGSVTVHGRVAALLELGSGFDPEFTGRENAYFNGALHGLNRAEMDRRFDAIKEFAEIGDFIERPVKSYSSGMFVRLAFSVAVHIDPDILIVDESLSVGDVFFQQKCFERLREMRAAGTSLLFVSHDGSAVQRFCDRAILLDHGHVIMEDVPRVVIDAYETRSLRTDHHMPIERDVADIASSAIAEAELTPVDEQQYFETHLISEDAIAAWSVSILSNGLPVGVTTGNDGFTIRVSLSSKRSYPDPHVGFKIRDRMGVVVYESNTFCLQRTVGALHAGDVLTVDFSIDTALAPGDYTVTVGAANGGYGDGLFEDVFLYVPDAAPLRVLRDTSGPTWSGIVNLQPRVAVTRASVEARH